MNHIISDNKYLGSLCKRGHDWEGTGQSLRRKGNSNCIACEKEYDRMPEIRERRNEYNRQYRKIPANKKRTKTYQALPKQRERSRAYYQEHKEEITVYYKQRRKLPHVIECHKKSNKKHRSKPGVRERETFLIRKARHEYKDWYIRNYLKHFGFPKEAITPALIETKRAQLQLARSIRERRHAEK